MQDAHGASGSGAPCDEVHLYTLSNIGRPCGNTDRLAAFGAGGCGESGGIITAFRTTADVELSLREMPLKAPDRSSHTKYKWKRCHVSKQKTPSHSGEVTGTLFVNDGLTKPVVVVV
jgi:hypothetical protein